MIQQVRRVSLEVIVRVHWLAVIVVLLCAVAIVWVLIDPANFPQCLILIAAAVPLALLERGSST